MFVRDHNGRLVRMDNDAFRNEKELYSYLWRTMYNIVIEEPSFNTRLIKYICGQSLFV